MKYIKGDILEAFDKGDIDVLLHQTNCTSGTNLAGIARLIYNRYPQTKKAFEGSSFGRCYFTSTGFQTIVNMNCQFYPGAPSETFFLMSNLYQLQDNFHNRSVALMHCLTEVENSFSDDIIIGLPLIGSGLAASSSKQLENLTDLDYFIKYIANLIKPLTKEFKVNIYYL